MATGFRHQATRLFLVRHGCFPRGGKRPRRIRPSSFRALVIESLEVRNLLTAEGQPFDFSQVVEGSGLGGSLSATIDWGDGSTSDAAVAELSSQPGPLTANIDYRFDTEGFFASFERRDVLQLAVDSVISRLADDLAAIAPNGDNTWSMLLNHPGTGEEDVPVVNPTVNANEIVIFAGGRALEPGVLAEGGPGGVSVNGDDAWRDTVLGRGESNAYGKVVEDFAPWGGSLAFSTQTDWYFGETADDLQPDQMDFFSITVHELSHLLGVGTSGSWFNFVDVGTNEFTGPASVAEYDFDGDVPLEPADPFHWADGTTDGGADTALSPSIEAGSRRPMTALDFAALDDIGWDLTLGNYEVEGNHIYADNGMYDVSVTVRGTARSEITQSFELEVENVAPSLSVPDFLVAGANQLFSVGDQAPFSDPGFPNPDAATDESFTYSINWGDGQTDSGDLQADEPGSAGNPTRGTVAGEHTYQQPGDYLVSFTVSDDDGGTTVKQSEITVLDEGTDGKLLLVLADAEFSENAGEGATMATLVRRSLDVSSPLTVNLSTSDESEVAVPETVEIPADESSVQFAVDAVDDFDVDGTQSVVIAAAADSYLGGSGTVSVMDFLAWQNPVNRYDVDGERGVEAYDAVQIISVLRSEGTHALDPRPQGPPAFYDVTGDNWVSPLDAIQTISALRSGQQSGPGEGESPPQSQPFQQSSQTRPAKVASAQQTTTAPQSSAFATRFVVRPPAFSPPADNDGAKADFATRAVEFTQPVDAPVAPAPQTRDAFDGYDPFETEDHEAVVRIASDVAQAWHDDAALELIPALLRFV